MAMNEGGTNDYAECLPGWVHIPGMPGRRWVYNKPGSRMNDIILSQLANYNSICVTVPNHSRWHVQPGTAGHIACSRLLIHSSRDAGLQYPEYDFFEENNNGHQYNSRWFPPDFPP
jgi:hypothetical protein